ncbi:MAG TPA: hypothetical protein V6D21_00360 [Candidatus Obscuribacterales bacterium]
MNQEMRQEILTLAKELPDELLPEALASLKSLTQKARDLDSKYIDLLHQKLPEQEQNIGSDNSSTFNQPEFDKVMQIYKQGSEKYKNALRELAK